MNKTSWRFAPIVAALLVVSVAHPADYLTPEHRADVDRLVREQGATTTNQINARARARQLWDWLNAFAMTGRFIPVNATQYVNSILALEPDERVPPGLIKAIDDLIQEFSARDSDPDAIGTVTISDAGPFIIDSWHTVEVTYTVGTLPISDGGVIVVGRHFRDDGVSWQHNDPAGDGYISIRATNPGVDFEQTTVPVRGMHGGFRGPQAQIAFRLIRGSLDSGDAFTVVYGDTAGGGRGFQVQSYSNDAAPLPLYVDFNREDVFFSLPTATYAVVGKEPYAVHGFVPSVVGVNEPFDMSVRFEDEFFNRATGRMPFMRIERNGNPFLSLAESEEAIQVLRDVRIPESGVSRFTFASSDGKILGSSDPIWVQDNPATRIYWGETHGHCGFAEGQGSADSYFAFGRDDARLDFLTLSEHDIWMDDYEWELLNELSARYNAPGRFVTFPGYEWTAQRDRGGHHNVFFRRTGLDRVPGQDAPTLSDLYVGLHRKYAPQDVLVGPHAHQAADWRSSDVHLERLVEIMSMHGTFEWFGERYLAHGHEVGFISASDDHLSHPGYSTGTRNGIGQRGGLAAVFAPELTNDAIFDALRTRQTYATSGARMILDARMNGHPMGMRQPDNAERVLTGRVMGTAPIASVSFIKNGAVIDEIDYERASIAPHTFVQVGFHSQSDATGRDNPRGYRPWRGTLTVSGATLRGVSTPGLQDRRSEYARTDESKPNLVEFATATRGRMNHFVLDLDGVNEKTQVRIQLRDAAEYGTAPRRIRPAADLPAADITFSLADLEHGPAVQSFEVDRYRDDVTLKAIDPHPALDRQFEFRDTSDPMAGDHYYVRVRQNDGGLAWSSPFWVGGESPR